MPGKEWRLRIGGRALLYSTEEDAWEDATTRIVALLGVWACIAAANDWFLLDVHGQHGWDALPLPQQFAAAQRAAQQRNLIVGVERVRPSEEEER